MAIGATEACGRVNGRLERLDRSRQLVVEFDVAGDALILGL